MAVSPTLNPQERLDWLRLIRSENIGPVSFHQLLQRYGSAGRAIEALPDLAARGGRREYRVCSRAVAERELAGIAEAGARLIAFGEPDYPTLLAEIDSAPPLVTVCGQLRLLKQRTVAIVGARNASSAGQRIARELAAELGAAGLVVASGLARGIDAAAHRGALASGTVAVVAGGVDVVYPEENRGIYDDIVERGAVIAEMPLGTEPRARHFPRRNRLISGLSAGVVVVEAAMRSGSLLTARLAAEQGRDVFAVPGSPLDPRCRGTNDLLRNGAILTETAADVVDHLRGEMLSAPGEARRRPLRPEPPPAEDDGETDGADGARRVIRDLLGPTPVAVDELVRQCHLSPATVLTVLLEMELAGRLERHPGGQVSLDTGTSRL